MIDVKLIAYTGTDPLDLSSHAAKTCYTSASPEMGDRIDVENRLFKPGHHTTLQHSFFTFQIEGIAVGDVKMGLHMTHPFYNSDERSGRFAAKMYREPNLDEIKNYLVKFYPDVDHEKVMNYIEKGIGIYQDNIEGATKKAEEFIKEERPYASEKYIEQNAKKIAQEQLRMFIPMVFPTGLDTTLNLTAIVAMYESAWSPALREVTEKMANLVIEKFPELEFMFDTEKRRQDEWAVKFLDQTASVKKKPELKLLSADVEDFVKPDGEMMHPVDKLHFTPEMMENNVREIKAEVELSCATLGQDQRHRTLRRSTPKFSGSFYLAPILDALDLEDKAKELTQEWLDIASEVPSSLAILLAPHGAMVRYTKTGSLNAIAHEQAKRLCWCAQEEIYHIGRLLRLSLAEKYGSDAEVLNLFEPPCYGLGYCTEGVRYCGREIKEREGGDYFPERNV